MNTSDELDTDQLLTKARSGDSDAAQQLLDRHRQRLKAMVAFRMDAQLAARIDPSDVVQDSLILAHAGLSDYLRGSSIEFYPWLRRITLNRLIDLHRRHLRSQRRSVLREVPLHTGLPDHSAVKLADQLVASGTAPLGRLAKEELRRRVRLSLELLSARHREVLVLRFLEQLSIREAAQVLEITENAFKARQLRALNRLRELLEDDSESDF